MHPPEEWVSADDSETEKAESVFSREGREKVNEEEEREEEEEGREAEAERVFCVNREVSNWLAMS